MQHQGKKGCFRVKKVKVLGNDLQLVALTVSFFTDAARPAKSFLFLTIFVLGVKCYG